MFIRSCFHDAHARRVYTTATLPSTSHQHRIELDFLEKIDHNGWLNNSYFPNKDGGKPAWLHLDDLPAQEKMVCRLISAVCTTMIIISIECYMYSYAAVKHAMFVIMRVAIQVAIAFKNVLYAAEPPVETRKPLFSHAMTLFSGDFSLLYSFKMNDRENCLNG
uniref:Uncharacterized protein n=1 Tax=Glossina pallidipes TaxID=7398 RepID=A0A1A9ZP77_GLOPL